MSTYIQWSLYGKDTSGVPISEERACNLCAVLDDVVTEWHGDSPDGECIAQFLTTYNNGYSDVIEIIGEYAKTSPDCIFQIFCHNEDEDWYQQIHFHGEDCETLDGHIVYDPPQPIFYDDHELQKEV